MVTWKYKVLLAQHPASRWYTTWRGSMTQLSCIGLSRPLTNPPFELRHLLSLRWYTKQKRTSHDLPAISARLLLLQISISPSWRKLSKLNLETQALHAQGNHMRRQNASTFCWHFSHLFFVDFAILLASLGGASSNSEQWSDGGNSHRALLDYTYHKDTAMRRYALINAAPSNQFDSPSTMVLPTILTTLVKMFWKKWCH